MLGHDAPRRSTRPGSTPGPIEPNARWAVVVRVPAGSEYEKAGRQDQESGDEHRACPQQVAENLKVGAPHCEAFLTPAGEQP